MPRFVLREEFLHTEWFLVEADTEQEALEKFNDGEVDRTYPMDELVESRYPDVPIVVERQFY